MTENINIIKGKTAIVTGGSRGIGEAIAYELASLGVNVAVIYAGNSDGAIRVCRGCNESFGVKAKAYKCDVSDYSAVKETVAKIKADFDGVHILINNAGVTCDGLVAMMKEEDYDRVLGINLKGAFNMIRHVSGLLIREKWGCIINIASVSGIMGNAGQCNYSASKAGLIGLTKSVAKELAPKGIRCNAIAPGFVETDMTKNQGDSPLIRMIPLGRMGLPKEVAQGVTYLVQAEYVTGETLRIDGGIAM